MTTFGNPPAGDATPPRELSSTTPFSNKGRLGWTAGALSLASLTLIMTRDPFGLSLICAVLAIAIAVLVIRRAQSDHVGTQLGLNLGIFLVMGWFVIRLANAFLASGAAV